ncbi:type II toxin-antitoxin system death-on-curing family toxin [Candidatus Peregrinibacteria bacterium CG11_big_fil_rev_8_21_14_0_20_46_8]|nr:MAG: type II toxin-antitoxin system death-on-curing family toxin [Candidatus Peregrinibacteria bacterium CG11_big_fil_rev_8_21_14_0_20_46_8]
MIYLTVADVIAIHDELVRRYTGSFGIRSQKLLESAVFRIQASFGGELLYKNIFEQSAAILESLIKNHPFIDGNKRTAFVSAVTFLELNGYKTKFDAARTEKFILDIVAKKKTFAQIANFLKKNSEK